MKAFVIRLLLVLLLLHNVLRLLSETYTVKQDSTGDFVNIQDAVYAAGYGDTVLVWPGFYNENIELTIRNIYLGSLTMVTNDLSYIQQTIIHGKNDDTITMNNSCITIMDTVVQDFEINGFTIQNGRGWQNKAGGGIRIFKSHGRIKNCIIQNNYVNSSGGGLQPGGGNIFLSNVTIRNNYARKEGGGISGLCSNLSFDTVNKCNIYCNYAAVGTDIYKTSDDTLKVVVDTFTVIEPDYYYLFSKENYETYVRDDIIAIINTPYLEQTSDDLYVSPNGDNNNTGTSINEPLKNIYFALLKAKPDTVNKQNIHLAEGIYSVSSNDECIPLGAKNYINIIGTNNLNCIIDAEFEHLHFYAFFDKYLSLENLSFINGIKPSMQNGSCFFNLSHDISLKNLIFDNNEDIGVAAIRLRECDNVYVDNCKIINSKGSPVHIGNLSNWNGSDSVDFTNSFNRFTNCTFINTRPSLMDNYGMCGFQAFIPSHPETDSITLELINCLFVENVDSTIQGYSSNGVMGLSDVDANIINCTFANNQAVNSQLGASFNIINTSKVNIYNSIFYNNEPAEMKIFYWEGDSYPELNIFNSLVMEGELGIINEDGGILYYDITNIDSDPLFYEGPDFPYNLGNSSPCIDAGTLNLPEWIELPATDLAGNPRIYGETIDMGAYEWNPTVSIKENNLNRKERSLSVSPNPVSSSAHISAYSNSTNNLKIEVFGDNGQRVAKLTDGPVAQGTMNIDWDINSNGIYLKSGVYIVVLSENGVEKESVRIIIAR